ncbi:hypothetical protein JW992_07260 [candidate division KSB1 bacterium]|nr:hypothetical protein [candidate division KSB1 bacterium]
MKINSIGIRRGFVAATFIAGIAINAAYAAELTAQFFASETGLETGRILISALTLEIAWAALLVWALFNPGERRQVLLLTALAMWAANLLHSQLSIRLGASSPDGAAVNLIAGTAFSAWFVFAFLVAKPTRALHPDSVQHNESAIDTTG